MVRRFNKLVIFSCYASLVGGFPVAWISLFRKIVRIHVTPLYATLYVIFTVPCLMIAKVGTNFFISGVPYQTLYPRDVCHGFQSTFQPQYMGDLVWRYNTKCWSRLGRLTKLSCSRYKYSNYQHICQLLSKSCHYPKRRHRYDIHPNKGQYYVTYSDWILSYGRRITSFTWILIPPRNINAIYMMFSCCRFQIQRRLVINSRRRPFYFRCFVKSGYRCFSRGN